MLTNFLFLCHGTAIGFFGCCSVYFIKLRGGIKNRLQYILGLIMLLWFMQCLKDLFYLLPSVISNPYLVNVLQMIDITSIPPCMFLCLELVKPGWCTWKKLLIYELPFILLIILFVVAGGILGQSVWSEYVLLAALVYSALFSVYNIAIAIISAKEYNKKLRNTYSYVENLDIHWMRGMLAIFLAFVVIWSYSVYQNSTCINSIYYLSSVLLWSVIIFFINKQQNAIYLATTHEQESINEDIINSEEDKHLLEKWNVAMIENKMFLNPHLTLVDMSIAIGTNRSRLSHFVNSHFGVSFLDYVNALRIDYAVPMLHEPNAKISAISKISGFCSQNTFYRYFKNRFGCTPGEYINNLNSK